MNWLTRLTRQLIPSPWRDTISDDLVEEADAHGRGAWWTAWQTLRAAAPLRWTFAGDAMRSDLGYAIRSLARARWFTAGAALTFALGIGVNLAVFSAVDRILFRALPYTDSQNLVVLRQCSATSGQCGGSFPAAVARAAGRLATIGELAFASLSNSYAAAPTGDTPPLRMYSVSANVLEVLGVKPVLGRGFTGEDEQSNQSAAMVSFETWQDRFGGQASVIGTRIGRTRSTEIVGVLPKGFIPPSWTATDAAWNGLVVAVEAGLMAPIARLRPGASVAAARAEVSSLAAGLDPPASKPGSSGAAAPLVIRVDSLDAQLFSRYQDRAWLVVVAAAVVLLMACTNLAGLLLARGRSREHEAAIRTALGASAARIVLAAIFETGLVCLLGSGLAWLALVWTSRAIAATLPALFSRYMAGPSDLRVVGAALAVSVLCAIIAGAWPGARMARVQVAPALQRAGGAGRRARLPGGRALLFVEAALGTLLVLGAVLAISSFDVLVTEDIGYQPKDLYRVSISAADRVTPDRSLADFKEALRIGAEMPNVIGVAGADASLTGGEAPMRGFSADRSLPGARFELTAGYFRAVGGSLVAGREFTPEEVESRAPVAMLNAPAVALVWRGLPPAEAVGRALTLAGESPREIIGIAPQVQRNQRGEEPQAAIYLPLGATPARYTWLLLRMAPGAVPSLATLRQKVIERLGPHNVGLASVAEGLEPSVQDPRFRAVLLSTLALCALLLAAAGLYAMASFEVSLRRYEVGVRMTLGASAGEIQRLVMLDALKPVAAGVAAGGIVSTWSVTWFQSFLYKVDGRDWRALALVALVLLVTAAAAAWLPARRAAATDPAVVLRAQ